MLTHRIVRVKMGGFGTRSKFNFTEAARSDPIFTLTANNAAYHILKIDRQNAVPFSARSNLVQYSSNGKKLNIKTHKPPECSNSEHEPFLYANDLTWFAKRFRKSHTSKNLIGYISLKTTTHIESAKSALFDKSLANPQLNSLNIRMFHSDKKANGSFDKMARLIDGKQIASEIQAELKEQIVRWQAQGHRAPKLMAILIGDDPASATYVSNKMKAASFVGIDSETERYGVDITEEELISRIEQLNEDEKVDGILVQLPVPGHINERKVCNTISCDKDVDGFNERNVGRLCLDMNTLIPCTPLGVQELIKRAEIETFGKNAVVVGRSKNVGMPIAMLLHADGRNDTCAMDATVTICHRFTPPEELKRFCRSADIIITATGVPGLITADMVKEGAAVIDVGITRVTDPLSGKAKLVGDVDFEGVRKIAGFITPVPGGVGPMTVAMLMKNTVIAAKNLVEKRNVH